MLITADRVVVAGEVRKGIAVDIDDAGRITKVGDLADFGAPDVDLRGRVLLPGAVNAHSHSFQRLLRGRTQRGNRAGEDNFWSWREAMYRVAS